MIHQTRKEMAAECDEAISKFMSLNFDIEDTEGEHNKMVFILRRHGYTLEAYSPTKEIKSCKQFLDDCYHLDDILQELHTDCINAIGDSKRYSIKEEACG